MEKIIKSIVKSSFFTSGVLILLGLLLFIKSDDTIVAISYIAGGIIIVLGILALISFFRKEDRDFTNSFDIIYGIITIVFGIFILSNPKMVASVIPFVIGLCVLVKSSFKIAYAIELKHLGNEIWKNALITSIISALVGVVMLFNPFRTSVIVFKIIGAAIIIYAVLDIISTFQLKNNVEDFGSKNKRAADNDENRLSNAEDENIVDADVEEIDNKDSEKKSKKNTTKKKPRKNKGKE